MRIILAAVALTAGVTISGVALCGRLFAAADRKLVKMEPLARTGLMLVPITLNGVEKKFLFDTGGAISIISRRHRRRN